MKRLFLFLLLVPVGAAVIWSMGGCGARTEVAVAKVTDNPTLMRLRELEVLEKIASTGNLNVILGEKGLADRVVNLL
jgi:hypothetical protein